LPLSQLGCCPHGDGAVDPLSVFEWVDTWHLTHN
jgi:hypothetical protein